jgi:hypothetical protein
MEPRCRGTGLIIAGSIVTLIGLGIVTAHMLALPREWNTVAIGVALLTAGLGWRALRTRGPS